MGETVMNSVSDDTTSWFHCGRCGSLFRSPIRGLEHRKCISCGQDPSLGTQPAVVAAAPPVRRERTPHAEAAGQEDGESSSSPGRESRSAQRSKGNRVLWKIVVGWLVFLGLLIYGARVIWNVQPARVDTDGTSAFTGTAADERKRLLDDALPLCQQALLGFLQATSPEQRNQFVFSPVRTASRMARFYSMNPLLTLDPNKLVFTGASTLDLPDEIAVEMRWSDGRGKDLDVVFREENGDWRIDWSHFVRESDYPWQLFLAGDGEPEGEFRLLARERLADERGPGAPISLVLHAPRFAEPGNEGLRSPEILVESTSPNGKLLDAAFRARRAGRELFGSTLAHLDPSGMIRVRVKVRRVEEEFQRTFEITDVIACHWLTLDAPGVDPDEVPVDAPARSENRSRIDDD